MECHGHGDGQRGAAMSSGLRSRRRVLRQVDNWEVACDCEGLRGTHHLLIGVSGSKVSNLPAVLARIAWCLHRERD